jgi:hypothetical protein
MHLNKVMDKLSDMERRCDRAHEINVEPKKMTPLHHTNLKNRKTVKYGVNLSNRMAVNQIYYIPNQTIPDETIQKVRDISRLAFDNGFGPKHTFSVVYGMSDGKKIYFLFEKTESGYTAESLAFIDRKVQISGYKAEIKRGEKTSSIHVLDKGEAKEAGEFSKYAEAFLFFFMGLLSSLEIDLEFITEDIASLKNKIRRSKYPSPDYRLLKLQEHITTYDNIGVHGLEKYDDGWTPLEFYDIEEA